jgi:RNA polymerase I-specific transcription initiation factor RRN6
VLRLIRLRTQKYAWETQNEPSIALLEPDHSDQGYWMGSGGTIRQIAYSEDENGSSTWLAVRQSSVTTIFRPLFGRVHPALVPTSSGKIYPPSRLSANPVAVLTTGRSKSKDHRDVSFNPWYARQFAVVDSLGFWSIWDIEGNQRRHSSQKLASGKNGDVYDGYELNPASRKSEPDCADGWHRILWVCDISTIVVSNRRHVAVFDLKAAPYRLHSIDFSTASSPDWILDIKRSLANPNHLFVLTTARIFWIEVVPAGEDKKTQSGAKILLSYRHFRDANDETMRLTCLEDDTGTFLINYGRTF